MKRLLTLALLVGCGSDDPKLDDGADGHTDGTHHTETSLTHGSETDTETETEPQLLCPDGVELAPEAAYLAQGNTGGSARNDCEAVWHASAGAAGSTVAITLNNWEGEAFMWAEALDGTLLADGVFVAGDVLEVEPLLSGEFFVFLEPVDPEVPGHDYGLSVDCLEGCDVPYTRYPVVLMHGMAGTEAFLGVLDYFYDVVPTLDALGYHTVVAAVDPFQVTEVRAAAWAEQLQDEVTLGHARKFNLHGHSQGGMDARWVAHHHPELVASVTTLATPHHGAAAADLVAGLVDDPGILTWMVNEVADAMATLYGVGPGQDLAGQLVQLSPGGMEEFNIVITDAPSVAYYSWAGETCQLLDLICIARLDGEIVTPLLSATHLVSDILDGPNDGLVSVRSAKWGTFLGTVPADHLDEVGMFPGTTSPGYDHLEFFESEAVRLFEAGF